MPAFMHRSIICMIVLTVIVVAGCKRSEMFPKAATIQDVRASYDAGDYETAYANGGKIADSDRESRYEAAYLAALSALQTERLPQSVRLLQIAKQSPDYSLVHQAQFQLGLVLGRLGRHDEAATELLNVAPFLKGRQQSDAYFHGAMSQRELARLAAARTSLLVSRASAVDGSQWRRANEAVKATGFTLQIGVYADKERAREHARAIAADAEDKGYGPPRIVTATANNNDIGLFRHFVNVGRFPSHWSAGAARRELQQAGALIVPLND